jgi:hypothetical protein
MSKKTSPFSITNKKIPIKDYVLSIFYKYFKESEYIVTYFPDDELIYISISSVFDKEPCIQLSFNNKEMDVSGIHRCLFSAAENISNIPKGIGNNILKQIITIGKQLKLKKIMLFDASTITNPFKSGYYISLYIYKILIEGESWYNKNGFKHHDHDIEKKIWDIMRKDTFIIIFLKFKDNTVKKQILDKTTDNLKVLNKYSKLQTNMFIFLEKYSIKYTAPVEDVFKKIEKIRLTLEGKKIINEFYFILDGLIDIFQDNIKYSRNLVYNLK